MCTDCLRLLVPILEPPAADWHQSSHHLLQNAVLQTGTNHRTTCCRTLYCRLAPILAPPAAERCTADLYQSSHHLLQNAVLQTGTNPRTICCRTRYCRLAPILAPPASERCTGAHTVQNYSGSKEILTIILKIVLFGYFNILVSRSIYLYTIP